MRLEAIKLHNFRAYRDSEMKFADLTALIGRNDAGKSSVLDALAIFFDHPLGKFEETDKHIHAPDEDHIVSVGCVFSDYPQEIVLDSSSKTTLPAEHLLNRDGLLEIHRVFDLSGAWIKDTTVARAFHPTQPGGASLLTRKNADLKKLADAEGVDVDDKRSNVSLRQAIWGGQSDLGGTVQDVPLSKEGGKEIWEQIKKHMPTFALFRADRASTDEEAEVQDPMKLAVKQAMELVDTELDVIREKVREHVTGVAERTLEKLQELDPRLASELKPHFKAEPKWEAGFKLTLTSDNEIPINKRGSGVRRLVLLSFFRAEAERMLLGRDKSNIIYVTAQAD